jgi:uncharacterized membrane protein YeaQ/YmgE (transglycosylase-associated protein family)
MANNNSINLLINVKLSFTKTMFSAQRVLRHAILMCGSPIRLDVSEGSFAMNESLVVVLLIGLLVGWVTGNVVRFSGLGLAGDLTLGLLGAFLGHWLLPAVHIHLGYGLAALVADATVGAVVLLLVFGLISFGRNWKGSAEKVSRGFERLWRTPN